MVGVWQEKPPAAEGCRFKDFRFGAFINRCTLKCIKWTSENSPKTRHWSVLYRLANFKYKNEIIQMSLLSQTASFCHLSWYKNNFYAIFTISDPSWLPAASHIKMQNTVSFNTVCIFDKLHRLAKLTEFNLNFNYCCQAGVTSFYHLRDSQSKV